MLNQAIKQMLHEGTVIPAHPLALTNERKLDEKRQRALTRYYLDAGAGGIAVGVHTTQFEIREPKYNLFQKVLALAIDEMKQAERPVIKIAGLCGPTQQAVREAAVAKELGYDLGLLSMGGLQHLTEEELLERTKEVAQVIPVFGFYLQLLLAGACSRSISGADLRYS